MNGIAVWNGADWEPLGLGFVGEVYALTTWDPDGPGPLSEQLIAAGNFTKSGGTTINRVARWDGAQWWPLGSGVTTATSTIYALTTWDADGPGAQGPRLVVGGSFLAAGSVSANYVASWDGSAWSALGTGTGGWVRALTSWDPDGAGPQQPLLVVGGDFNTAGGIQVGFRAAWTGSQWQAVGGSLGTLGVNALCSWDPDGDGPASPELIAGGRFSGLGGADCRSIARWNGASWRPLGAGMATGSPTTVACVTPWDPDGEGPEPARLFAGGDFQQAGDVVALHAAIWDDEVWAPTSLGVSDFVTAFTTWDPDGHGPQPKRLVAAGDFASAGSSVVNRITYWDGSAWHPIGAGFLNNDVVAVTTWDPDGDGPDLPELIAGGYFTWTGGGPINRIAKWNGTEWAPLGSGVTNNGVEALTTWDPVGAGPARPLLIAAGIFDAAGGITVNNIAAWNGEQWQPLGGGVSGGVNGLAVWDPDGPGPMGDQVVAVGSFTAAGGSPARCIARWDGVSWSPFGSGVSGGGLSSPHLNAVTVWDPDGDGPLLPQIVVGGNFWFAGGTTTNHIARWDGSSWSGFGSGMSGDGSSTEVRALTPWDPDGSGPAPTALFAGGNFQSAGSVPCGDIARWNGSVWSPVGTGVGSAVYALQPWAPDESAEDFEVLLAGGFMRSAGAIGAAYATAWSEGPVVIGRQPQASAVCAGSDAVFSVEAAGASLLAATSFGWRRDGVPLVDGPTGTGSFIAGSATNSLIIGTASAQDAGSYECVVTNSCGPTSSDSAMLTVVLCCPADLNGDGVIDFGDYLEFLNLFDALDPRVDFNGDGVIDFLDYLEFLNHFDAGC